MYTNVLVDKQTLSGRFHRRLVPMIVWGGGLSRGLGGCSRRENVFLP